MTKFAQAFGFFTLVLALVCGVALVAPTPVVVAASTDCPDCDTLASQCMSCLDILNQAQLDKACAQAALDALNKYRSDAGKAASDALSAYTMAVAGGDQAVIDAAYATWQTLQAAYGQACDDYDTVYPSYYDAFQGAENDVEQAQANYDSAYETWATNCS